MGKLIVCSGARTKIPYVFASAGIHVYSIEELSYFLYHHVYLIEDGIFGDSLIDWIGIELKLPERAEKLREAKQNNADLKTMVTIVLCSCDYFTENEIKGLLRELDEIIGMPPVKRNIVKAGRLLSNKQYCDAAAEYERLLDTKEAADLSQEDYGDILHNLAVARLHTGNLREASELFYKAYEHNRREASLRQFLYAARLSSLPGEFEEKALKVQADPQLIQSIEDDLEELKEEAKSSGTMNDINQLRQYRLEGRTGEFYRKAEEIIGQWKKRYIRFRSI